MVRELCPAAGNIADEQQHQESEPDDGRAHSFGSEIKNGVHDINRVAETQDSPSAIISQTKVHERRETERE